MIEKKAVKMEVLVLSYSMYHVILIFEWLLPGMIFIFVFQNISIHVFYIHRSGLNTSMIYSIGTWCNFPNILFKNKKKSEGLSLGRTDKELKKNDIYSIIIISLICH